MYILSLEFVVPGSGCLRRRGGTWYHSMIGGSWLLRCFPTAGLRQVTNVEGPLTSTF